MAGEGLAGDAGLSVAMKLEAWEGSVAGMKTSAVGRSTSAGTVEMFRCGGGLLAFLSL